VGLRALYGRRRKRAEELSYWRSRKEAEGELHAAHYEAIFTGLIGLERGFYAGKDVLDVGCGPRGSLEWAEMARRRVGLDPLADDYRALGIEAHAMEYVVAPAEAMPFEDASFDVVASVNSLDHVDDLDGSVAEIKRVLRPGGHLVLAVEVGHEPTWTEPQSLGWDVTRRFEPELEPVRVTEYERGREHLYDAAFGGETFDHADPTSRTGLLIAVLRRP
jgi:ubiquinone/menaquinone biosynthesis C-methylase UbiE